MSLFTTFIALLVASTSANPFILRSPPDGLQPDRRGIAYNNPAYARHFALSDTHVQWCYNWDSLSADTFTPFEYVAMLHSNRPDHTGKWAAAVERSARAQPENPTHLLGFNEPDNCQDGAGGCCMSVETAVEAWWMYMEPAKKLKEKMYLGSPAVSNGGGAMGLTWLKQFLEQCVGCSIDFICIHWYDAATNIAYFKSHLNAVRAIAGGRPIWVTEFAPSGTDDEIKNFLNEALPWMDDSDDIARYAYFMAAPGMLLDGDGSGLSEIGKYYVYWHREGTGFSVEPPKDGRVTRNSISDNMVCAAFTKKHNESTLLPTDNDDKKCVCQDCHSRCGCFTYPCDCPATAGLKFDPELEKIPLELELAGEPDKCKCKICSPREGCIIFDCNC